MAFDINTAKPLQQGQGGFDMSTAKPIEQQPEPTLLDRFKAKIGDVGMGAIKGASEIGATILAPADAIGLTGMTNDRRRAYVDEFMRQHGADTEGLAYKGGKLATEIAGTAGAGGVLAKGVRMAAPAAEGLATALETGGMSTGQHAAAALSAQGVKNAAVRVAGGAGSGAGMTALTNPEDAGTGAVLGGAIPVVGKVAGELGRKLGKNMTSSPEVANLAQKAEKLGIDIPADRLVDSPALNAAAASLKYMPGSGRAATESKMNDQIKRALSNTFGEDTAILSKDTIAQAQSKLGKGFDDFLTSNKVKVDDKLSNDLLNNLTAARKELAPSQFKILKSQVDDLLGKTLVQDGRVMPSAGLSDLEKAAASMPDAGVIQQAHDYAVPEIADNLLSEIRKLGGVSMRDAKDLMGENQITKMGVQGGVFTTKGEQVGDMVRRLVDRGVIPKSALDDVDGGAQYLRDAIQEASSGMASAEESAFRAAHEAYNGVAPDLPISSIEKFGKPAGARDSEFVPADVIDGKAAYNIKKTLDRLSRSPDSSVSYHAKQIRTSLMDALKRSVPEEDATAFAKLQRQYSNLKSVEKLAGNSAEGNISMARLGNLDARTPEQKDLAQIAATFAKGRESPHGAMQRVSMGAGLAAALGGGALAGVAAPVAMGLTAGKLATMALNSKTAKKALLAQRGGKSATFELIKSPLARAALAQSR